jgi:uncharacterized protein YegJ (DUF2314 family)
MRMVLFTCEKAMSDESHAFGNINFVPKEKGRKPDPKYAAMDPAIFVGRYVKLGFDCKTPDGDETTEHMWVEVKALLANGLLQGTVNNDPFFDGSPKMGAEVQFSPSEIEDLYDLGEN